MKFSIIVPVYNVERYLESCLDSIATQDFSDYEVVIVDDGSTDNSSEIYGRFAATSMAPVQIIKKENGGLLSARRTGIKAARGDYLWHVDGDDAIAPHAMRSVSSVIDSLQPEVVLIGLTGSSTYDSLLPGFIPGEKNLYTNDEVNAVRRAFLTGYIPSLVMKVTHRSCVDVDHDYAEYGRLQFGEDQLQSLYILEKARTISCLREPLYYYRTNEDSISAKYREGQLAQYATVKSTICRRASVWDKKWPGNNFAQAALEGYLSNGYYDMRKSVDPKRFRRQFSEFRETAIYGQAIGQLMRLRFEQRLFYALLSNRLDLFAYWYLLVCRTLTPLVRRVRR